MAITTYKWPVEIIYTNLNGLTILCYLELIYNKFLLTINYFTVAKRIVSDYHSIQIHKSFLTQHRVMEKNNGFHDKNAANTKDTVLHNQPIPIGT